ncbi:U2 small nuclear ribonucleoprotein auxiliary factor 35 kDa subunit-related protein 2, partial [Anthonomus grandis grandis]|uniref:U2 small nuclear ribonucleoprotein auxiliary factor 35 kDa subunit-related protein 2 n=1 Tax=Anthonomus grandis grandis TaxID=2921223 RepID=UPI0021655278
KRNDNLKSWANYQLTTGLGLTHREWRKHVKKERRKRIRQTKAKERDNKLLEEQKCLEALPEYQKWLQEQEILELEREKEEQIQSTIREEQWKRVEKEAQEQWQEIQKKIALAREEKIKQNMKIKLEWEKEQEKLKEIKLAKEKELEEKRIQQLKHEKELLDFLELGGDTPEHLRTNMESNPGKMTCPFFAKVFACRFFDHCSRNHIRPGVSNMILIRNFFSDLSLEVRETEHGSDSNLEFEKEEVYERYKEFFYDIVLELEKYGKIIKLVTCCNHSLHLRGNVYVEFDTTREALVCYHKFNGRWYAGRQLNVEFCNITCWKNAICGVFFKKKCPKGDGCNFLHVFHNPEGLYTNTFRNRTYRQKSKREGSSRRRNPQDLEKSWDRDSPNSRRNWRWSESPEPYQREERKNGVRESTTKRRHVHKERYSRSRKSDKYKRSRSRSRVRRSRRRSRSNGRRSSKRSRSASSKSSKSS